MQNIKKNFFQEFRELTGYKNKWELSLALDCHVKKISGWEKSGIRLDVVDFLKLLKIWEKSNKNLDQLITLLEKYYDLN